MVGLEEVYGWFNWQSDEQDRLSVPVNRLINHMKEALEQGNHSKTEDYIELSIEVSRMLGSSLEIAEVSLECAYAFCQMQDYPKSKPLFRQAINLYGAQNIHNKAVASWMLGCVYWQLDQTKDAIVMWERSCRIFEDLKSSSMSSDWYAQASDKMCQALKAEIDKT